MGYGHQRTAYPLIPLAFNKQVIQANDYAGIPKKDKRVWETTRNFYELISNFRKIPLIGKLIFSAYDQFQKIINFYPKKDISMPTFVLNQIYSLFDKGWGKHLIGKLGKKPLPVVSTFFTSAFMADFFGYPGEIYCVICDTDISRTWAPLRVSLSKIKYFAPNERVVERLKLYGVKSKNIFLTGYPLPLENIGTKKMEKLKRDLAYRLVNLDPKKRYFKTYEPLIRKKLGRLPNKPDHILTLMFSIGGAGAQKEIGLGIIKSLAEKINEKEIRVILSVGIKKQVKEYFEENIERLRLKKKVEIIFAQDIEEYFARFNKALRKTDILWTKPSELSFYTGLGLPVIIAPPIGSQEDSNQEWLLQLGSGIKQKEVKYADQWLYDLLNFGWFAEAAMQGFMEAEKLGALNIKKILSK